MVNIPEEAAGGSPAQQSTVFNNKEDSDITIEFSGRKIHAHRAILRMYSPFFARILQSQWPVSKGPVFSLGDEDDPEIVEAMLLHMYNLPYTRAKPINLRVLILFHVKVFVIADKYDCPSLSAAAIPNFRIAANDLLAAGNTDLLTATIPALCGPDALQPADPSLREEVLDFCATNYDQMFMHRGFQECLKDGTLFDTDTMVTLLEMIGAMALKRWDFSDPRELWPKLKFRKIPSIDPLTMEPAERCQSSHFNRILAEIMSLRSPQIALALEPVDSRQK